MTDEVSFWDLLRHRELPNEIASCIGQVVHATTRLEWIVSCFAYAASGQLPGTSLMTQVGSVMKRARSQVDAFFSDDHLRARMHHWLDQVGELREERNQLVHADWRFVEGAWVAKSFKDGLEVTSDKTELDKLLQRITDMIYVSFVHAAATGVFGYLAADQAVTEGEDPE